VGLRLDEERLEMLRSWGEGLAHDPRDEVRAAGKAILMLIEEVEFLHVDLWHARGRLEVEPEPVPPAAPEAELAPAPDATPVRTLRDSIARLRSRQSPTASA
jgi:hypothetical protein